MREGTRPEGDVHTVSIAKRATLRLATQLGRWLHHAQGRVEQATLPRFATPATGLVMNFPREISGAENIEIGAEVKLGPNSVLKATSRYPGSWMSHPDGRHVAQTFRPRLRIGDRVTATSALQVVAFDLVEIEDEVLFAANVYISDGMHATTRGDEPYKYQGIARIAPVRIGRGAWIGQNVVVMPGVTIGAHAVIGANSVVTRDVPASTVAVGSPARVVRVWNERSGRWQDADRVPG